jgi:hypothetical protein
LIRQEKGQATTEVVLLFPLFLFFLLAFAKVFALLILVQKLEIASFYASRRWQLESHRNASFEGFDSNQLLGDIQGRVCSYLGYDGANSSGCQAPVTDTEYQWGEGKTSSSSTGKFLDLTSSCRQTTECTAGAPGVTVQRTQVWNVVTVTACTGPVPMVFYQSQGFVFCSTKYVPNRDRPIAFVLPGLNSGGSNCNGSCGE